jgi:hypothetical protein
MERAAKLSVCATEQRKLTDHEWVNFQSDEFLIFARASISVLGGKKCVRATQI